MADLSARVTLNFGRIPIEPPAPTLHLSVSEASWIFERIGCDEEGRRWSLRVSPEA